MSRIVSKSNCNDDHIVRQIVDSNIDTAKSFINRASTDQLNEALKVEERKTNPRVTLVRLLRNKIGEAWL